MVSFKVYVFLSLDKNVLSMLLPVIISIEAVIFVGMISSFGFTWTSTMVGLGDDRAAFKAGSSSLPCVTL